MHIGSPFAFLAAKFRDQPHRATLPLVPFRPAASLRDLHTVAVCLRRSSGERRVRSALAQDHKISNGKTTSARFRSSVTTLEF
jgi:hypothetical protein